MYSIPRYSPNGLCVVTNIQRYVQPAGKDNPAERLRLRTARHIFFHWHVVHSGSCVFNVIDWQRVWTASTVLLTNSNRFRYVQHGAPTSWISQ